jgi:two-component system chemotaxis sensor kinase CheA
MDFLDHEIEEILNIFREESEEQIQKLNKNLLKLESNPKDYIAISELFREAHSLKGAARMIGLNDIQSIAHKLEDVIGQAKEGYIIFNPEIIDTLCRAVDCISSIVDESIKTRGKAEFPETNQIVGSLELIKEGKYFSLCQQNESEDIMTKSVFLELTSPKIKDLKLNIKINIEKLKFFSSNMQVIEETIGYINILADILHKLNSQRLQGLILDIKCKLESTLRASGMLLDEEITEIEEIFDTFSSHYERLIYPKESDIKSINNLLINCNDEIKEYLEQEALEREYKPSCLNEISFKEFSDNTEALDTTYSNDNFEYLKTNIKLFGKHTEENIEKFNSFISRLENFSESFQDHSVQEITSKIIELLNFSKENYLPLNDDMVAILEESLDMVGQIFAKNETTEKDPTLIVQRIQVLHQILKLSLYNQEEKEEKLIQQEEPDIREVSLQTQEIQEKITFSPVKKNADIITKAESSKTDKVRNFELKPSEGNTIKTLRVDTQKLDQLVSQVGELIIAKIKAKEHLSGIGRIIRMVEEWHRDSTKAKQFFRNNERLYRGQESTTNLGVHIQNKSIHTFFEENSAKISNLMNLINSLYKIIQEDDARLNLIVNELEERIKSIRVLPLATIFHLFPRMVRDIAREKNKEIEFVITGSETSVDKKIIEEIKSPLTHIIRNSIDHGIESSEERVKNGKDPVGKILLAAYHLENSVLIEVTDDGKGINIDAIKKKVLQKELLTQEEIDAMSEEQIMNIIFWPGFSTGETVTDISGRGIGLDIVYTKISQLNGKVKVKSSLKKGCQVSIQLPVTMATIKSFLVEVNNQTFAIPTSSIKTTLLVKKENVFSKEGRTAIIVEGRTVPICSLSDILEMPNNSKKSGKLVIIVVQAEDVTVGFIVDRLIGDQEILHKNLSAPLLRVRNVAGITTLGSGDLCIILNVKDLVKSAYINFGKCEKTLDRASKTYDKSEKNILVVDDSQTTRILQKNILKAAGYKVNIAVNGLDALTKILSGSYDIVVSDIEMPEINGIELTERLRRDEKYKDIPIILVSSLASESDRLKGINAGANAYITKGDFDQEQLLQTINELMG